MNGAMTDLLALTDATYWTLPDASPREQGNWYWYRLKGMGIYHHASLLPVPARVVDDIASWADASLRAPHVVGYGTCTYAGRSSWGHGEVCLSCGAEQWSRVSSSVTHEDAPGRFARDHRH